MKTITGYLTYSTYKVIDEKPVIHLFIRTKEGEQICVIDKNVEPFFYIQVEKDKDGLKKVLQNMTLAGKPIDYKIVKVEEITKKLHLQDVELLKVTTNIPAAVPHLQKELVAWDTVKRCFEYDVRFAYRYLMDKDIIPQTIITAQGDFTTKYAYQTRVFEATSVKQEDTTTYEKPRVLAIDIETYFAPGDHINMEKYPILMIALHGNNFTKVLTYKEFKVKDNILKEQIEFLKDEAEMLKRTTELIKEYSPDIITGYNSDGFDLPYIKKRARKHKVKLDIGLDNSDIIAKSTSNSNANIIGISHIDIYKFIRRVMSLSMSTSRYSLDAVSEELLGKRKVKVDMERLPVAWDESIDEELENFAIYNIRDTELTYQLFEYAYPLMAEITKLIGQSLFDVSRMSFSQFVEWFIMKKAHAQKALFPNRPSYSAAQLRSEERFKGAFVVTPKPGLYHDLVVFDFRSLYPTILASHNISIDTLNVSGCKTQHIAPIEEKQIVFCADKPGFLADIMTELIMHRKEIKKQIKEQGKTPILYARSQALKYICNSFYGYLGFSQSRWYSLEASQAITAWGRHYINQLIDLATKRGFTVTYGDTDSVFLQRGEKSKDDAIQFIREFNTTLPNLMELELQGFYPSAIFVAVKHGEGGAKKRYALCDEKGNVKIAGFETVRRNTSPIAKEVQKEVLEILLKENDAKKALKFVQDTIADLKAHKVPKEKVVIFTQLTRPVHEYETVGPHVAAAKRMIDKGQKVTARSYIYYIVSKGAGKVIRDKVRLPEEVTDQDYDADYYINNQVLPSVERIFDALGHDKSELTSKQKQSSLGKFF